MKRKTKHIIAASVSEELKLKIDEKALELDVSVSTLINNAIRLYLKSTESNKIIKI